MMSSHWPTADQEPGATLAEIEFAHRWRDMPKVVFSSTTSTVDWNTRLFTGDAVTEITRLKAEDSGPMDITGATLAAAAAEPAAAWQGVTGEVCRCGVTGLPCRTPWSTGSRTGSADRSR